MPTRTLSHSVTESRTGSPAALYACAAPHRARQRSASPPPTKEHSPMNTATITGLILASDGVILVTADCDRCHRTVLHGAGANLDALVLGHRLSHCGHPGGYELTD